VAEKKYWPTWINVIVPTLEHADECGYVVIFNENGRPIGLKHWEKVKLGETWCEKDPVLTDWFLAIFHIFLFLKFFSCQHPFL